MDNNEAVYRRFTVCTVDGLAEPLGAPTAEVPDLSQGGVVTSHPETLGGFPVDVAACWGREVGAAHGWNITHRETTV